MASKRENIRRALEDEGASKKEIAETLAEIDAEEEDRGPDARARRAGVPRLYAGVTFDDIKLDDDRRIPILAARNWVVAITTEDPGELATRQHSRDPLVIQPGLLQRLADGDLQPPIPRGLYLWGDGAEDDDETGFGTGKTRIAAAVAQHAIDAGRFKVRWLDIVRAMTDLNFPFGHPTYAAAAERLCPPKDDELVILDDIDKQPPTDRNVQPIFALVNDCVNNQTPLVITANRHPDDLREDWGARFGHAAASRLIGHCLDVEVTGRDWRYDGTVAAA